MNYEQFICAMIESTKNKLSGADIVERKEMLKNNGVIDQGIMIRREGKNIAPIVYMEAFYEKYMLGASIDSLTDFLIRKIEETPAVPTDNYEDILDFEKIKSQISCKLINAEKNKILLKDVPNLPMMDLAIVFYWSVPVGETEQGAVMIKNSHMDHWKIPISVLYRHALENMSRLCSPVFVPLSEFVKDLPEDGPLYVLSNDTGINGATVIIYPQIMKMIYERLESNYYMLPSSIHEFLVIPEDDSLSPERLKQIVRNVNRTQIRQEEFLSDHVYYFDGHNITKM